MDRLANLGVGGKAFVGITVLIALGVCVVAASIMSIMRIETTLNEITDVAAPTVETTADVTYFVTEAHKVAIEILADEEPADIARRTEEFNATVENYAAAAAELDEIVSDPDLQAKFEETPAEWTAFLDAAQSMFDAHSVELQEEQTARELMADFEAVGTELIARLQEIADLQEGEMQAAENRADELAEIPTTSAAQLNDLVGDIFEEDYPAFEAAMRLKFIVATLEGAAREYMASENPDALETIRAEFTGAYKQAAPEFAVLVERAESGVETQQIATLKADFDAWVRNAEADEQLFDTHRDMLGAELEADLLAEAMDDAADILIETLDTVAGSADAVSDGADEQAAQQVATAQTTMAGLLLSMIGAGVAIAIATSRLIGRPINNLTETMQLVSSGNLDTDLPSSPRTHEIGKMTNALVVFLDNARKARDLDLEVKEKEKLEREREEADRARDAEQEKERRAAEERERETVRARMQTLESFQKDMEQALGKAASGDFSNRMSTNIDDEALVGLAGVINRLLEETETNIDNVVHSIGELSQGNLGIRMDGDRQGAFLRMKDDFNAALTTLSETMAEVMASGENVSETSSHLEKSSNAMSKRGEDAAAAVEETSAAVEQISASIRQVVKNAKSADAATQKVRDSADETRKVSDETEDSINAMTEASKQINRVVKVIEDIAFQINLLALNAGVEAARAGEAGRGFSVVASEVRALAQRSQDAVQEISQVIDQNNQSVEVGVEKVAESRKALEGIISDVEVASSQISEIAQAVEQQSVGIEEVNTAVRSIDKTAQTNAASLEEMTAASVTMSAEATTLAKSLQQFHGVGASGSGTTKLKTAQTVAEPPRQASQPQKLVAVAGDEPFADCEWEDF